MSFESMGLSPEILQAVKELGYETPSPIQLKSIPHAMTGKDLMACAQTGTGKTAAFSLPMLHRLSQAPKAPLRALVLVPTRELAIQVSKNIRDYAKYTGIESTAIFGGVPFEPQTMMLRHGVDILIATPGRLIDHMWRGNIDYRNTEFLVLDEADRMLDMGFIDAVKEIVREIPTERQTMLFSATLGGEIQRLSRGILHDPTKVEVAPPATTVETVEQKVLFVEQDEKRRVLERLIQEHDMKRAIIFTRTKVGATKLAYQLRDRGYRAAPIHSDRSQSERVTTLEAFREGKVHLLVATDIAARGIDV
ncbi:MAG: DEAD/DEAH box helicase, partial [Candidatus Eisenbacteria bacterium]|nr:DEAD/DEAH box helicase [Candidatus Eisenbacteria bacterium]